MKHNRIVHAVFLTVFVMITTASCQNSVIRPTSLETVPTQIATATEIPMSTPTPHPTFSPAKIEQEITRLYFDNGGCELPCFWGITPGKTTLQELNARFSEIGTISEEDYRWDGAYKSRSITVKAPPEIDILKSKEWVFQIITLDDTVVSMVIGSEYLERTSIPRISNMLSIFGKPEEIWIEIQAFFPNEDSTSYIIALFYPSQGIRIRGSGNANILYESAQTAKFSICPQLIDETIDLIEHYPFTFQLWSPESKMSFSDLGYGYKWYDSSSSFLLDNSRSSIKADEFYTAYLNPSTEQCFDWTLGLVPP